MGLPKSTELSVPDDEHSDGLSILPLEHRAGRVCSHGHGIFVQGIQGARVDQEVRHHLLGVRPPGLCQLFLVEDEGAAVDVDLLNANAAHNTP